MNIFYDNWIFDMPLRFKPIILNMNLIDKSSRVSKLIMDHKWDLCKLNDLFGPFLAEYVSKINLLGLMGLENIN